MQTVVVTKTINAPIEDVFEAYTDHERLADLPMVISAKVVTPGKTEKNGLGAVRVVNGGAIVLREEITGWERPKLMEYKIVESRPASTHELGRVEFTEVPGGTHITWTTRFGIKNPTLARVEPAFALLFRSIFVLTLHQVGKRAVAAAKASA
ncbi:MAG: SRPBCC family protein [Nocardioides sp.]|nr:SRPBCC family protein [Nocardioides sp.]